MSVKDTQTMGMDFDSAGTGRLSDAGESHCYLFSSNVLLRNFSTCLLQANGLKADGTAGLVEFSAGFSVNDVEAAKGMPVMVEAKVSLEEVGVSEFPYIPVGNIKRVVFRWEKEKIDLMSRVEIFPDIPLEGIRFEVDDSVFFPVSETVSAENSCDWKPLDVFTADPKHSCLGGALLAVRDLVRCSRDYDALFFGWLEATAGAREPLALPTIIPGRDLSKPDVVAWASAVKFLKKNPAQVGIDEGELLEAVRDATGSLDPRSENSILKQWHDYARAVLDAEKELPRSLDDSEHPGLRAILVFMVAKDFSGLEAVAASRPLGLKVQFLARMLIGLHQGIGRMAKASKGSGPEELSTTSQWLLDVLRSKENAMSKTPATLFADHSIKDEVRYSDQLMFSREFPLDDSLVELLAKARRQHLVPSLDPETGNVVLLIPTEGTGHSPEDFKLFLQPFAWSAEATGMAQRLLLPFKRLPVKGLTKAQSDMLMEVGFDHGLAVCQSSISGERWASIYWLQVLDTFDHVEFAFLVSRIKEFLSDPRIVKFVGSRKVRSPRKKNVAKAAVKK